MLVCPNVNDLDWQDLVNEVGEREAYRLFIANNFEIPVLSEVSKEIQNLYAQDTVDQTAAKVAHLSATFAKHNVEVEVELNGDAEDSYMVGTGWKQAKIVLNPEKVFSDTVAHEFGHIYVDLLGFGHPHIQTGIDQLRGTDLWNEIADRYANEGLDLQTLEKEILTTAIGREYVHQSNQPKWMMWLNKLFRLIGEKLGIERNVAKDLAMDMINGNLNIDLYRDISTSKQKQIAAVAAPKAVPATTAELTKMEKAHRDVMDALATKIAIYKNSPNDKFKKALKTALQDMKKMKDKDALIKFIRFADVQTKSTLERLEKLEEAMRNPTEENKNKRLNLQNLARIADYMASFDVIDDVAEALHGQDLDSIVYEERKMDRAFHEKHIAPIQHRINAVAAKYRELAKPMVADFLIQYNTNKNLTRAELEQMLSNVTQDISFTQRWGDSLAESPDQVLALFDKAISTVRAKNHKAATEFKLGELKEKTLALEKYQSEQGININNFEQLYDFMLGRDDAGLLTGRYKNPKLDKADPRQQFYEMFDRNYKASQNKLPRLYRRGSELIGRLKTEAEMMWEDDKSVKGLYEIGKKGIARNFTRTIDDTDFIEVFTDEKDQVHKFLPVHYTARIGRKGKQVSPDSISLDLASNLYMFKKMADNFKEMNDILPELEGVKNMVLSRSVTLSEGDKFLVNKNSLSKKPLTKSGAESYAAGQLLDFFDRNVYGQHKVDEGNLLGIEGIDQAKTLDALGNYTSIVQLGLNLYSGINNSVVGQVTNYIEGTGGQFYERKDWLGAHKEYDLHLPSIVQDAHARFPTGKLGMWLETFDILQEYDENGQPIAANSLTKRLGTGALFFLQKSGEHVIQSQLAIAMAKHHRIDKGEILSYNEWIIKHNKRKSKESRQEFNNLQQVWDAIEANDGKLKLGVSDAEMIRFTERIKGVSQRLHGNYAKKDQAAMKKWAMGRLVMKFRNWLKPGWNRRFAAETFDGKDVFDQRLGANIAGNYTIAFNFIRSLMKDLKSFNLEMMSARWSELPEWKKQGIQRTVAEICFMGGTAIVAGALGKINDDDDDDNWFLSMAEYQARRLNSELRF